MKDASPAPVEAAVKQEEDSGSKLETFPCLARGCGGTVALSADLCRFGHGVRVQCEGGKECHRFKWCNRSYALVPPQEWPTHLSWCGGNRTDHTPPIDSKLLRGSEEGSGEPAAPAEAGADGDSAAKTEAEGAAAADGPVSIFKEEIMEVSATEREENEVKDAAKATAAAAAAGAPSAPHPAPPAAPALVPARIGRPPRGGDGALRGAQVSSSTPTVRPPPPPPRTNRTRRVPHPVLTNRTRRVPLAGSVGAHVRTVLAAHRKAILCGDSGANRQWARTLRERRSRTLVPDISRTKLAARRAPAPTRAPPRALRSAPARAPTDARRGARAAAAARFRSRPRRCSRACCAETSTGWVRP